MTFRLLTLLVLFPVGLTAQRTALANAVAHHRAASERQRHAAGESSEARVGTGANELAVSGTHRARDCEHPRFYRAMRTRVTAPSFALRAPAPALVVPRLLHVRSTPAVRRVAPPRADLVTGPPPSLRAPPVPLS